MCLRTEALGEFFTRCPLLENLSVEYAFSKGNVKSVDLAKLEKLKILSLALCELDPMLTRNSGTIFELVGSLPKLQELCLDFHDIKVRLS